MHYSNVIVNNGTISNLYGGNNAGGQTNDANLTLNNGTVNNMFGGGNASPELKQLTSSYLKGVFIGAPAFIILVILNPLVQLDGNQHLTKLSSIAIIFVDIVGDFCYVQ